MNTMAWIAIAAMIVASINSWLQFWLKQRSEKNKALADAKPATNQPKPVETRPFIRRNILLIVVTLWLVTNVAVLLAGSLYGRIIQFNAVSLALLVFSVMSVVSATILLFRTK